MQRMANPFQPYTPIGAGIQNIAQALFSSRLAGVQNAGLAEQRDAQTALLDTKRLSIEQEMERRRAEDEARANALPRIGEAIFGSPERSQQFMDYRSGRQVLPEFALSRGEEDAPIPLVAAPRPDFVTPQNEQRFGQAAQALALLSGVGGGGQAGALDNLLRELFSQDQVGSMLAGDARPEDVLPANFAAGRTSNAPNVATGQVGTMSPLTGAQTLNPIGTSMVAENEADAALRRAQGVTEAQRPALVQAQTQSANRANRGSGRSPAELIPTVIPMPDGTQQVVNLTPAQAANHARLSAPRPTEPKPETDLKVDGTTLKAIEGALTQLAPGVSVDDRNRLMARANAYYQQAGGQHRGNVPSAVQQAVDDMMEVKPGTSILGFGNFGGGRVMRKEPKAPTVPTGPQAGDRIDIPQAAPAAGRPPQQALAALREGHETTFGNGQVWTLRGGQPVRVR